MPQITLSITINGDGSFTVSETDMPGVFAGQGDDLLSAVTDWVEVNEDVINQLENELMEELSND